MANFTNTIGVFTGSSNTSLLVNSGATFRINMGSSNSTFAGTISGFGNAVLKKTGSGTLTISGSNDMDVVSY